MFPFFLGEKTKKSHTLIIFYATCFRLPCKDSANRMQNKMNPFIFYAEVQPIFAFSAKI